MDIIKFIRFKTASSDFTSLLAKKNHSNRNAFTLVELLVSMVILVLILVLLTQVIGSSQKVWSNAAASVEQFRQARVAFEAITRRASQAVLNPYIDYDNANDPKKYQRQSDLAFISGPRDQVLRGVSVKVPGQVGSSPVKGDIPTAPGYTDAVFFVAPLGYVSNSSYQTMNTLLNGWGYYLDCSFDDNDRPTFLQNNPVVPAKRRFRLYEWRQPSENLMIYVDNYPNAQYKVPSSATDKVTIQQVGSSRPNITKAWFASSLTSGVGAGTTGKQDFSRVIANNIIALIISPRNPGLYVNGVAKPDFYYASKYFYSSRGILIPGGNGGSQDVVQGTANQLPPQLDITMVALDSGSAARYDPGKKGSTPPVPPVLAAGSQLFQKVSSGGTTPDQYQADLVTLEKYLSKNHLNYQVFRVSVPIRAAKFSTQ